MNRHFQRPCLATCPFLCGMYLCLSSSAWLSAQGHQRTTLCFSTLKPPLYPSLHVLPQQAEGECKVLSHWPLWIEQENGADGDQWWNVEERAGGGLHATKCLLLSGSCTERYAFARPPQKIAPQVDIVFLGNKILQLRRVNRAGKSRFGIKHAQTPPLLFTS